MLKTTDHQGFTLMSTAEEAAMRDDVGRLAKEYGPAFFQQISQAGTPRNELWNRLGAKGYLGIHLPAEFGGGGQGLYEFGAVMEECAREGIPILTAMFSTGVNGTILARHGTREQKQRWLPRIATGEAISAFAMTEPQAGLNSYNIETTATQHGDGWVLNGSKYYVSAMKEAEWLMVVARTGVDPLTGHGLLSLFLVDADAAGIEYEPLPTELQVPERQFTVHFTNVPISRDRLIGTEHKGLRSAFVGMNAERILVSSVCTGVGAYALARGVDYANKRAVWNGPIGAYQAIAHPLAQAKADIEAARLLTQKAGKLYDEGAEAGELGNMAKMLGVDAGLAALDAAIQTHGGNGFAQSSQLSNYWFLLRAFRVGPVSKEMTLNFIAQHSLGLPRAY
ncbi:acyl-CoA dehydrogenase family protein [Specibacter sp. RAF43]|uniref:acyl-CoA dehydrogenase family protein n=1 Tax=Specibacter sp. RAF43 TaxID=3233057 RepID=UPI003F971221